MDKEEQIFLNHLHDLADLCYQRNIPAYTDFLNLNEQTVFLSHLSEFSFVQPVLDGGFETAERKIVCFLPVYEKLSETKDELPIVPLKVESLAGKFTVSCTHRDYLGALLNLGIERSKTGDIIVHEGTAYVLVMKNISEFLINELSTVKKNPVRLTVVPFEEISGKQKFSELNGTVASVRMDSILSVMLHTSRSKAAAYITSEKVYINGKLCVSVSAVPAEGNIVSVRGEGKFIYDGVISETKKGRILIAARKYE